MSNKMSKNSGKMQDSTSLLNKQAEDMIALVRFRKKMTEEEMALVISPTNKAYISQQRSRGKFTQSFITKFKHAFSDVLSNIDDKATIVPKKHDTLMVGMSARQQVQSRYIAEIYAKTHGMSVTGVLSEMERLEQEATERLIQRLQ